MMILGIILSLHLVAPSPSPSQSAAPSPIPTSTNSPAMVPGKPAREVVYKVSSLLRIDDITESYGGGADAFAPASRGDIENHGTVTVDVFAKTVDGTLLVSVSEAWHNNPRPQQFEGEVAPDGTVLFGPSTISAVTTELLSYFATRFVPYADDQSGSHWAVDNSGGKISMKTNYAVTAVGTDSITIQKDQTIKALGSETIGGSVVYQLSQFVPISGKIRERLTEMYADGQTQGTLDLRFDLVSDTFQPAKP
jgi:hypothetical protein